MKTTRFITSHYIIYSISLKAQTIQFKGQAASKLRLHLFHPTLQLHIHADWVNMLKFRAIFFLRATELYYFSIRENAYFFK